MNELDKCTLKAHGRIFRCSVCGKFISYKELDDDLIIHDFIPDTEVTVEEDIFTHKKCII